ncbi:hypothetical protein SCHPADRAFT_833864 [Schizopora paradoxa]|uniref:Uncharacterized protein n=1 Tax=Schizopora paradoxa TaxID=27342 RepID=A0A0H2RJE1_9AGAM|nr:hypothetical protein SCHPADRAFT_833864 [Schizopora paradoxa]
MSKASSLLESLPLDVCDRLLTSLPSFACLRAAVLSCKALHETYSLRRHSIFNAVVENEAGPTLPEALVVLRAERDLDVDDMDEEINDRIADREGPYWKKEVSVEEAYALGTITRVALELEDLFSFRYKDRSKTTTALTYSESFAFRRALYHNWFLSLLCRTILYQNGGIDEDVDQTIDENTSSRFVRILSDLDDKSLSQLYQVLLFLDELFVRTNPRQLYNQMIGEVVISSIPLRTRQYAPSDILYDFKVHRNYNRFAHHTRADEAVTIGLDNVLGRREVQRMFEEDFKRQAVLEGVPEGYATQCASIGC